MKFLSLNFSALSLDFTRQEKKIIFLIFVVAVLKTFLVNFIPVFGDEAFFISWGLEPAWGYYDHPPMSGWIYSVLYFLGGGTYLFRGLTIFFGMFLPWGIYQILKNHDPKLAQLLAVAFLFSPVSLLLMIASNDIPQFFFAFLGFWFYYLAVFRIQNSSKYFLFFFAGVGFGAAILSKYFGVVHYFSITVFSGWFFFRKDRKILLGYLISLFPVLVSGGINFYWNSQNCWPNLVFNLYLRESGGFSLLRGGMFVLTLFLLFNPLLLFFSRKSIESNSSFAERNFFCICGFLPFAIFIYISLAQDTIGLHWLFSFIPLAYMAVFFLLPEERIRRTLQTNIAYGAVLFGILIFVIFAFYSRQYKDWGFISESKKNYMDFISQIDHKTELAEREYPQYKIWASDGYDEQATLRYHSTDPKRVVLNFDALSIHGRLQDFQYDLSHYNGEDILFVYENDLKKAKKNFFSFFESTEIHRKEIDGIVFYVIIGKNFLFQKYKQEALIPGYEKIYRPGEVLTKFFGFSKCSFREKYNF